MDMQKHQRKIKSCEYAKHYQQYNLRLGKNMSAKK